MAYHLKPGKWEKEQKEGKCIQPLEFHTKAFTQQNWTWVLTCYSLTKVINCVLALAMMSKLTKYMNMMLLQKFVCEEKY